MKPKLYFIPVHPRPSAAKIFLILFAAICCALPVGWMILQVGIYPSSWVEAKLDDFRIALIGRTIVYNGIAAMVATLLAMPVAMVLGRGRGVVAIVVSILMPIGLFIPSIVYTYGWKQFFRLLHLDFEPASTPDVAQCIWTLATWLWPVPAGIVGLSLRRLDTSVQQSAALDGALWRVTLRQLAAPIVAGFACATLLAMQEFAVYEPTGISVVATEVRMVFDTGAFSSRDNPITAPMSGRAEGGGQRDEGGAGNTAGTAFIPHPSSLPPSQSERAAAAIVTGGPLLLIAGLLGVVGLWGSRRLGVEEQIEIGPWPRILDIGIVAKCLAMGVLIITLLVPMIALVWSLKIPFDPVRIWGEFGEMVTGSLVIALAGGLIAMCIALASIHAQVKWITSLAMLSFLVGGQFLAIAQIRIYNRTGLGWVYNGPLIVVMTDLARFGWIALLAGRSTWNRPWKGLRDMATVDGASQTQVATRVIAPIAWSLIAASGVLIAVLCIGEVPATVLIQPMRPPMLIPAMMTWVHNLRFDPMIEASMLLVGIVVILSLISVMLARSARRRQWRA